MNLRRPEGAGRPPGRPVFEIEFGGRTHHIAVTIGDNGFIIGAGHMGFSDPLGKARPDPRYLDDPTFRGWGS